MVTTAVITVIAMVSVLFLSNGGTLGSTVDLSSLRPMGYAALVAIVLAIIFGIIASRSISSPIKRITSTASQIRNGDLTARTGLRGDDEIGRLGETFDDMATTLERDLKLEHRLTSDIAHELRTPLMAMLATVEAMQAGVLPTDEERLGVVANEVQRLSRLVDALLTLSSMENNTAPFEPIETDLFALVRQIVDTQEQLFADNGLDLELLREDEDDDSFEDPQVWAEVDRDQMHQAIMNLLSNSLRYTGEGGRVTVRVAQERNDALIEVEDTGMGIDPEDLSRVFSRFWRSDASREHVSGGLGVGLAVTKQIIDRHHGYISVESEVGEGTTFTLHIPREYRASRNRRTSSATM
ncbi:MAG: HAMP domain-containing histidine kinase [Atopobiaceae bacterium]|nr:HAMP domain-containing histidine kinase [Atopobiaceae bacterium]